MKQYNQKRNCIISNETLWSKAKLASQRRNSLVKDERVKREMVKSTGRSDITDIKFGAKLAECVTGRAKTVAHMDCHL